MIVRHRKPGSSAGRKEPQHLVEDLAEPAHALDVRGPLRKVAGRGTRDGLRSPRGRSRNRRQGKGCTCPPVPAPGRLLLRGRLRSCAPPVPSVPGTSAGSAGPPATRWSSTSYTHEVVVEFLADTAVDDGRHRHPVRFLRVRDELTLGQLPLSGAWPLPWETEGARSWWWPRRQRGASSAQPASSSAGVLQQAEEGLHPPAAPTLPIDQAIW